MKLVDTHAHLNFPDYATDLEIVLETARQDGVEKIICASSNLEDSQKAIEIAQKYPGIVYAAVGLHPQQTDPKNLDSLDTQLDKLAQLANLPEVVAIGECGLDYSPTPPGEQDRLQEEQLCLFEKQIELAKRLNLPLIIHSRKATSQTMEVLKKSFAGSDKTNGVWHCYSAGKSEIKKIEELGFYFGLDGNLTYDSGLQNVVKQIPLNKILLETDSPFLSPEPLRHLRNQPTNVKIIAEFLAQTLDQPFPTVSQITSENAQKVFPKIR